MCNYPPGLVYLGLMREGDLLPGEGISDWFGFDLASVGHGFRWLSAYL